MFDEYPNVKIDPLRHSCMYYINLNIGGRKQARDPTTSKEQVVQLLGAVRRTVEENVDKDYEACTFTPLEEEYVTSLQYGLLQESVGRWARPW